MHSAGVFLPARRRLGSCMTHRSDIIWIDSGATVPEISAILSAHPQHSHFPVCASTIDNIQGVLPVRAFLEALSRTEMPPLKALLRKPVFLPETVTIVKALTALRAEDCRMVFIIDEYGGIEGLITRNGLVGEILEDLSAENGTDDQNIFRREDGSWLVDGQVSMDEIREKRILETEEAADHEYHTLAGYLLSASGSIPHTGDRIRSGKHLCEIVDMDGHRIDKVLITDLPEEETDS